jgi:hypothetical protein
MDSDAATRLAALCGYPGGAASATRLCGLWAGMGSIYEIRCCTGAGGGGGSGGLALGCMMESRQSRRSRSFSFIVKQIECGRASGAGVHSIGDLRKRASYVCEASFYDNGIAARLLAAGCRVPRPLHVSSADGGSRVTICMSKLVGVSAAGRLGMVESKAVLGWLATLHAMFFGHRRADAAVALGLQSQGTYWYLDTRPDEHATMPRHGWEGRLRLAARALDERLKLDKYVSIAHGDLKGANILLSNDVGGDNDGNTNTVPLIYDFQYCGKACIGKDLAYFLTCGSDVDASREPELLAHYHQALTRQLQLQHGGDIDYSNSPAAPSLSELETLLQLCICDLCRWMCGWGWWGKSRDSQVIALLDKLDNGEALASEDDYVRAIAMAFPVQ